jgi:hypothetical protein
VAGPCELRLRGERGERVLRITLPSDPAARDAVVRTRVERAAFGLGPVHAIAVATTPRRRADAASPVPANTVMSAPATAHPTEPAPAPVQVPLFRRAA